MINNHLFFFYILDKRVQDMKYFSITEFTRSDTAIRLGIDNTAPLEIRNNIRLMVETVLDRIRQDWGSPIIISSGYRCDKLNKAVGGAENSGHKYGFCCDMQVSGGALRLRKFADFVKKWMEDHHIKYDEIIYESSGGVVWLHFSWIGKDGRQRMKSFDIVK